MPRLQSLSLIQPNRYYKLQATLKYYHISGESITAIVEQDSVQKRIKLPNTKIPLQIGAQYRFDKCFYSRNGWLNVKQSNTIHQVTSEEKGFLTLSDINENKENLVNHYITTILKVIEVGSSERKDKKGEQLTLTVLKCFANDYIVDVTLWNREVGQELVGKTILFQGFRLKLMTKNSFVLVSTVYSNMAESQNSKDESIYDPTKRYKSLSQVYSIKSISQMLKDLNQNTKSLSIITGKIQDATIFDYQGCSKCHKKLQGQICQNCPQSKKAIYWVCQLFLQDQSGQCVVYVFDEKLQGALKMTKKGSVICGRVKSTIKLNATGENTDTHILVGINSINF